ncbi:MAG TPA: hypothetical protein VF008_07075 [Niastella sp.]
MLSLTKALAIAGLIIISSSCASIVSKTKYPVTIDSEPRDADVTIYNRRGLEVFTGKTPALVKLKSGAGFFTNAIYEVKISKAGFTTKSVALRATLNGWYFGNLLFGGLVGLLIVDPATGAMYKLKQTAIIEKLESSSKTAAAPTHQLRIYDINEIPESWKSKLVAIK